MTNYPDRLTEIIYKSSGVKLTTAQRIAKEITEAGYRLSTGKAPLLTDEEISNSAYKYNKLYHGGVLEYTRKPNADTEIAKAQLEVAHKFYTGGKDGNTT